MVAHEPLLGLMPVMAGFFLLSLRLRLRSGLRQQGSFLF
jgi:hypothetical protein